MHPSLASCEVFYQKKFTPYLVYWRKKYKIMYSSSINSQHGVTSCHWVSAFLQQIRQNLNKQWNNISLWMNWCISSCLHSPVYFESFWDYILWFVQVFYVSKSRSFFAQDLRRTRTGGHHRPCHGHQDDCAGNCFFDLFLVLFFGLIVFYLGRRLIMNVISHLFNHYTACVCVGKSAIDNLSIVRICITYRAINWNC